MLSSKSLAMFQELDERNISLTYMEALLTIDLLCEMNFREYDTSFAVQYANYHGLPWANNPDYALQFAQREVDELTKFAHCKVLRVIKTLLDNTDMLKSDYFQWSAMSHGSGRSLEKCLEEIGTVEQIDYLLRGEYLASARNPRLLPRLDYVDSVALAEKILRHAPMEQHRDMYLGGASIFDKYVSRLRFGFDQLQTVEKWSANTFNNKFWSNLLSLLYRIRVPKCMPVKDCVMKMYREYREWGDYCHFVETLPLAREYNRVHPISALLSDGTDLVSNFTKYKGHLNPNPHNYSDQGSLVEAYLHLRLSHGKCALERSKYNEEQANSTTVSATY